MRGGLALLIFFVSLLGLLALQPEAVSLKEVSDLGKVYKVCGVLVPLKELERGCIYWMLGDGMRIKAVQFFGECTPGYACVYARLDLYRGERELVILGFS